MRNFKNHLLTLNPQIVCLLSKSNEGKTDQGIEQLGLNLAMEIKGFALDLLNSRN